jgi:hypothetical protein
MVIRTALLVVAVVALGPVGCSSSDSDRYDVWFTCSDTAGAACPQGQPCPTVPHGSGGCDYPSDLIGDTVADPDAAFPLGCQVGLPYAAGAYPGQQQTCYCASYSGADGGVRVWMCGQ